MLVRTPYGQLRPVAQNWRCWWTTITMPSGPGRLARMWIDPRVTRSAVARTVCDQCTTAPLLAVKPPVMV